MSKQPATLDSGAAVVAKMRELRAEHPTEHIRMVKGHPVAPHTIRVSNRVAAIVTETARKQAQELGCIIYVRRAWYLATDIHRSVDTPTPSSHP